MDACILNIKFILIHTDTMNRFINVSIKSDSDGKPAIRCEFLDPLLNNREWYCTIRYGSADCRNLNETAEEISSIHTNFIQFDEPDFGNDTEVCVIAIVRSGIKKWRLEGIYTATPDSAQSIFKAQNLILVGFIELLAVILIYGL